MTALSASQIIMLDEDKAARAAVEALGSPFGRQFGELHNALIELDKFIEGNRDPSQHTVHLQPCIRFTDGTVDKAEGYRLVTGTILNEMHRPTQGDSLPVALSGKWPNRKFNFSIIEGMANDIMDTLDKGEITSLGDNHTELLTRAKREAISINNLIANDPNSTREFRSFFDARENLQTFRQRLAEDLKKRSRSWYDSRIGATCT